MWHDSMTSHLICVVHNHLSHTKLNTCLPASLRQYLRSRWGNTWNEQNNDNNKQTHKTAGVNKRQIDAAGPAWQTYVWVHALLLAYQFTIGAAHALEILKCQLHASWMTKSRMQRQQDSIHFWDQIGLALDIFDLSTIVQHTMTINSQALEYLHLHSTVRHYIALTFIAMYCTHLIQSTRCCITGCALNSLAFGSSPIPPSAVALRFGGSSSHSAYTNQSTQSARHRSSQHCESTGHSSNQSNSMRYWCMYHK